MLRFMKYEIRGTYRYITGVLILSLMHTAIYHMSTGGLHRLLGRNFVTLCILLLFGTALVTSYIVGSFRKELYEDTATLPLHCLTGLPNHSLQTLVALCGFSCWGGCHTS